MRYKNAPVVRDKNRKRYYRPTIIPNIPLSDSDVYVYPKVGERLDLLAYQFYGDSNLWWIIAKANEISNGKVSPDPEKKLRIPTEIQPILEAVTKSNL